MSLTYLIDAEHGLGLLLSTNQCTTFTPQPVQHLKGSFGPLTVVFFKFWQQLICRKVAFPSRPAHTNFTLGWALHPQECDILQSGSQGQVTNMAATGSRRKADTLVLHRTKLTWKSAREILQGPLQHRVQIGLQLFEISVQIRKKLGRNI